MNPGKRIISKFETCDFSNILEVNGSVKKADIDIGAFIIIISCSSIGLTMFSIISKLF